MKQTRTNTSRVELDERWVREWVTYGLAEITLYLSKHAAFDAYYAARPDPEI